MKKIALAFKILLSALVLLILVAVVFVGVHAPKVLGFEGAASDKVDALVVLGQLDSRLPAGLELVVEGVSERFYVSTPAQPSPT